MQSLRKSAGWTAAGIATLTVLAPLPALADDPTSETGTVTVTRFDDRYADGLFDPSKTAPSGDVDVKRTSNSLWLLAADGSWLWTSPNDDGDYVFTDVPVGPAKVYLTAPNAPSMEVFFDATGATSAADIERLPIANPRGSDAGEASITVDADGTDLLVGMSALRVSATAQYADGTPATGLTTVEFGSGGTWYPATEYSHEPGTYEAFKSEGYGSIRHLPGELGLRLTPPDGYTISSVTAADNQDLNVTQHDGAFYVDSAAIWQYFSIAQFTVTLAEQPDTERPEVALVSPTSSGPFSELALQVDATDNKGLKRIVANIYRDGTLVKSTQTAVDGATSGTHTATVDLPDGSYTIKYNAQDLAGNISKTNTYPVTVDGTAPTATVKDGASFTVGADGVYEMVSFKLHDAGKIDKVELNGVVKDLSDNAWSDVNFVKPGVFGATAGENTLVVYDVAGNTQTITFTLV